jgi:hypothetical protein
VVMCRQQRKKGIEHARGRGEAVQKKDGGRGGCAGFPVKDAKAIYPDCPIGGVELCLHG